MPDDQAIIGLPGFKIVRVVKSVPLTFEVYCEIKPRCLYCNSERLRIKDTYVRRLRHESIGVRVSHLEVRVHKYYCMQCRRYFNERLPGVMPMPGPRNLLKERCA